MYQMVTQLLGFTAMAICIASYQVKSNRKLFIMQILSCGAFMIQFIMLGAYSGCVNLAVCIARNMLLTKYNDWAWVRWRGLKYVFCGIFAVITFCTWDGWISILPFIGAASGTIGFMSNNAQFIRLSTVAVCSPSWMLYDAIVGSWGGVFNELITITSVLISIKRYGWKAMGGPDSDFQKK